MSRSARPWILSALLLASAVTGCADNSQSPSTRSTSTEDSNPNGGTEPLPRSLTPGTAGPDHEGGTPFVVPDQFSIRSPSNGYQWSLARTMQIQDKTARVYACTKPGSTSAITLTVEGHVADAEAKRRAVIKGHYNGLVDSLTSGGFTELQGKRPSLDSPIPDRVLYSFTCRKPTGEMAYIHALTMFGKNIYSIQVLAGTLDEANQFIEAAKSLKELPDG